MKKLLAYLFEAAAFLIAWLIERITKRAIAAGLFIVAAYWFTSTFTGYLMDAVTQALASNFDPSGGIYNAIEWTRDFVPDVAATCFNIVLTFEFSALSAQWYLSLTGVKSRL